MSSPPVPIERPEPGEYPAFYETYIARVPERDLRPLLGEQLERMQALCGGIPRPKETFRYAEGKWSVREVMGHLIDAERVFGLRAYCFAHGERAPLPGFDEGEYVAAAGNDAVPLARLIEEFTANRRANILFFDRLAPEAFARRGVANGKAVSVRGLLAILVGHARHHVAVLAERYGIED